MASTSNYIVERESQKLAVGCHMHLCHGSPVWAHSSRLYTKTECLLWLFLVDKTACNLFQEVGE
jgi:hypothetical protein